MPGLPHSACVILGKLITLTAGSSPLQAQSLAHGPEGRSGGGLKGAPPPCPRLMLDGPGGQGPLVPCVDSGGLLVVIGTLQAHPNCPAFQARKRLKNSRAGRGSRDSTPGQRLARAFISACAGLTG